MLSPEFEGFFSRWRKKAEGYRPELQESFDKFFTLYVLFNRLYTEVTYRLGQAGKINLANRSTFPDAEAAQEYVVQFLGAKRLLAGLNGPECRDALERLRELVCDDHFAFKLDILTGHPRPEVDRELCRRLTSSSPNDRANAVLETLYAVRCNMFHGRKGYDPEQLTLLVPLNTLLARVVDLLYKRLSGGGG